MLWKQRVKAFTNDTCWLSVMKLLQIPFLSTMVGMNCIITTGITIIVIVIISLESLLTKTKLVKIQDCDQVD